MKPRMVPLLVAAITLGRAQCVPVSGERILARDMAQAAPVFAGLPPELALGYVPAAGARRTFSVAELGRLARRYGLAEPAGEACFTRTLDTLTRESVERALRAILPGARIEIVDFSRQPVPPGELRFPLSGLCPPSASAPEVPLVWRGYAGPPGENGLAVSAKVRIHMAGTRLVAAEELMPGRRIEQAQLRLEPYEGPPGWLDVSQVVGRAPRNSIPSGTVIEARMLTEGLDVLRGERVRVEVSCGRARVLLDGEAQAAGKRGQTILVRNPSSGKVFPARIEAQGAVSVMAPGEGEHQ